MPGPWFDAEGWERLGQRRLEFLSPEFVAMLEHACHEARRLDLRLAMNLGMGWPPGGPWVTDEHRSKHLVARSQVVPGPRELRGEQALPVPAGAMVFAWRIPPGSADDPTVEVASFRDLRGYVTPQNQLEWDVPDGTWLIGIFHYAPGGLCDKGNGPEIDPGSREAVLFHLDHIFKRIEPRLDAFLGWTLVEVASDSWEYERRGDARYWSPAIWDCDTGTTLPAGEYRLEPDRISVALQLASHESALIVCTRSDPAIHAVRCEGGRVVSEPAHALHVWLDDAGPGHVTFSDGRTDEYRVELPEPIRLEGPWQLVARPEQGVGLASPLAIELNPLVSWRTIPELRTFSGTLRYQMELDLSPDMFRADSRLMLELGEVYELADVRLNGCHVGTSWFPPHCLDLTDHARSGKNTLLIDVPNVLKNHLEQGEYDRPSGLVGPVRIRPVGRVELP